jgi:ketosteroid isomerase-like protein
VSRENVELVRSLQPTGSDLVEVFSAIEHEGASAELTDPFGEDFDVRFVSDMGDIEGRGPSGFLEAWRDWLTPYKSYRVDVEDIIDAGDEVLVLVRVKARTERDDVEVEHAPAALWSVRDGKITAVRFFLHRADALEAAGLSEELAEKTE